jgi:putative spermidine/putrescine transport system permease protein
MGGTITAAVHVPLDRGDLRRRLHRAGRRQRIFALLLVVPLLIFLSVNFLLPIGLMLLQSIDGRDASTRLTHTAEALRDWTGDTAVGDAAAAALIADLAAIKGTPAVSAVANRLNYDINGLRSLLLKTTRRLPDASGATLAALMAIDPAWERTETWSAIQRATAPVTSFFLLSAIDARRDAHGAVRFQPPEQGVLRQVFARTFWIGAVVTILCILLGYPLAYLISIASPGWAVVMMAAVLLPFWTSLLVRTSAWVVLLQTDGVINRALQWIGVTNAPLALVFNRTGVYIALVHVLLPFMVLPVYSVMRGIKPEMLRAAISLGASPLVSFLRVYLPLSAPGLASGSLLVFISAIGFYITPALIGGAGDQMIGYFIAHYINDTVNWGLAAALGTLLLLAASIVFFVYARFQGVPRTSM